MEGLGTALIELATGDGCCGRAVTPRPWVVKPNKGKQLKAAASRNKVKGKSRSKARPSSKPKARHTAGKKKAKKAKKVKSARSAKTVTRARATTPHRATHGTAIAVQVRRTPIPSPLPTRHVAPARAAVMMPARSMPPTAKEQRRVVPGVAATRPVVVATPEFTEAGVLLAITYSIREGRRGEFFDLMRELKPLLHGIGGGDVAVYEDRSRPNYLMEVFRFKDELEFTAFDDKFHKDRKIAAIYALLDDIVEAEKSDFKIFERRL